MNTTQSIQEYWAKVHEIEATLPPIVFLVSVEKPYDKLSVAGRVTAAEPLNAAKALVDGGSRIATEDEIAKWHAEMDAGREKAKAEAIERKGIHIINQIVPEAREEEKATKKAK